MVSCIIPGVTFLNPPFIISILIAITVHEFSHGFVAYKLGDPTAKMMGRLTINPLAHLDPIGALMFLFVGFGWAKPVPVDPRHFRHEKRDTCLVSAAGPASNLFLAFIAFALIILLYPDGLETSVEGLLGHSSRLSSVSAVLFQILTSSLFVNLALMAFNLLPIAPLDGSKVLSAFLPYPLDHRYDELMRYGPYILLALILLPIPFLSLWVHGIMNFFLRVMGLMAGLG